MKKILLLILCCTALFACNKNSGVYLGEATSVVVSKSKLDLHVGETATLTATVHPTSLGMAVTWASLDEEIAKKKSELEKDEVVSDYVRLCALNEEIEALETEQFEILEEIDEIETKLK